MVDAMEEDFLPEDPDELKDLCKDLMARQMVIMMSIAMSGLADDEEDFDA